MEKKLVRGVIIGVPVDVSAADERKKENVTKVKFKTNTNGIKCDSLSVLITFNEERLPEKIFM